MDAKHNRITKNLAYMAWLKMCQARQRAYIESERARYKQLETARNAALLRYREAAHALGLHALEPDEIQARYVELARMEQEVSARYGDTLVSQFLFEIYQGNANAGETP